MSRQHHYLKILPLYYRDVENGRKDCNQWQRNCGVTDSPNGHCFYLDAEMNGYDFCSYGERKDHD